MDGPTAFIMLVIMIVFIIVNGASYDIGRHSVMNHISTYGCEKTISVYDINMEKKK